MKIIRSRTAKREILITSHPHLLVLTFTLLSLLPSTLILLSLSSHFVAADELYDFDRLVLKLHLQNSISIVPESNHAKVEELVADLFWWPRDSYREKIDELVTTPESKEEGDARRYEWHHISAGDKSFSLDARITTSDKPLPVTERVLFPIESMPASLTPYTKPAKLININDDIKQEALLLAADKNDLFTVVYTIADWVTTNINYNLSSIAATANEPSTWVMANREGVCDEMTSLFISMLRSLNIPARFVSGVSYTNLPEFAQPWGGHGWAEVWFPNVGWVPFDVTYGTYGYVDATHIKLQDSIDAGGSSVDFTMTAQDANLMTRSLDIGVRILQKWKLQNEPLSVTLTPFAKSIGLESYQLITATVQNNLAQYVSTRLQVAQTKNLKLLGNASQNILLKPKEQKKVYFIFKTEGLRPDFLYTFPVELYAGFRKLASTNFTAERRAPAYEKRIFEEYLTTTKEQRPYHEAYLNCEPRPARARLGERILVNCTLTNKGRAQLQAVQACISKNCQRLDLPPGKEEYFTTEAVCRQPGIKSLLATTRNRIFSKATLVTYDCLDTANVEITNISSPKMLSYDDQGKITFSIVRKSETLPTNLSVQILHDNFKHEWMVERLIAPQRFTLNLLGRDLDLKNNSITLRITYSDELGAKYATEESLSIEPYNFTLFQKISVIMLNIERWLENLITQQAPNDKHHTTSFNSFILSKSPESSTATRPINRAFN